MHTVKHCLSFHIKRKGKVILHTLSESGDTVLCMIDTGANVPTWFLGEEQLEEVYPSAYNTGEITKIYGFSAQPLENVPVWVIPEFTLVDDTGAALTYHNLYVLIIDARVVDFDMLLPLTLLNRTRFTFDYMTSARKPQFVIESYSKDFYVRPVYVPAEGKTNGLLTRVQICMQDSIKPSSVFKN